MTDRRSPQPFNIVQVIALAISAIGLILGPCFGAGVAVIGTYVSIQSKSAVSDQKVDALAVKVGELTATVHELAATSAKEQNGNVELKAKVDGHDKRLDEVFTKLQTLEAHDSKQESQNAELLGRLHK
jgi:hypothetical protein